MIDEALVIKLTKFGDQDLIVHCFTKEHGRMSFFAKSARKSSTKSSPKYIGLMQMAFGNIEFKAAKSFGLSKLIKCDLSLPLALETPHLHRIARSYYILELIEKLVPLELAEADFYNFSIKTLQALSEKSAHGILRIFELQVLQLSGLLPDLFSSRDFDNDDEYFDIQSLKLCNLKSLTTFVFSRETQKWSALLLTDPWSLYEQLPFENSKQIARLFQQLMKKFGYYPLKTVQFLKQLPQEGI